jgi:hypothetical protein
LSGEVDDPVGDDAVELAFLDGRLLDVAGAKLDLREAGLLAEPPRLGELLVGHVHAHDAALRAGRERRDEAVGPRAAAKVKHRLALCDRSEV